MRYVSFSEEKTTEDRQWKRILNKLKKQEFAIYQRHLIQNLIQWLDCLGLDSLEKMQQEP